MSENKGHGYGWEDLRRRPLAELVVGDTWVLPAAFAASVEDRDGRVRGIFGHEGPRGTAWTVTARDGDRITARGHDGREATEEIRPGAHVLAVVGPEPVGTVLEASTTDRLTLEPLGPPGPGAQPCTGTIMVGFGLNLAVTPDHGGRRDAHDRRNRAGLPGRP